MAYLKNENGEIIVDAILTKYGRNKLSQQGQLGITKFSLSDDEIDYALYNTNTAVLSSEFYDIAIRQLPILEALPSDDIAMVSHLFTDTNSSVSTVSLLSALYPKAFDTGYKALNTPAAINPVLTPVPTNIAAVYYVAQLTDTLGAIYSLTGIIDPSIGITNEIIQTQNQLALLQAGASNVQNIVYAVGHSFTFTLTALPRYSRVFTVKITAYGPVNTNSYSFNINVPGLYSSINQVSAQ